MGIFEKFGEYYDLIYRAAVNYGTECNALEIVFSKFCTKKPASILDLGCGTGSHCIILGKRGYEVNGIDVSNVMIEQARKKAEKEKVEATFFVQDMRALRLDKKIDCAICLFGGFGYVTTYEDLVDILSGLEEHLNKDGLFVFEFWNIGGLKPTPYQSWMKIDDRNLTLYRLSESNFDSENSVLKIDFEFVAIRNGEAETFQETHRIRCYTLEEIQQYLCRNSFKMLAAYDWDTRNKTELVEVRNKTFRVLAIARNVQREKIGREGFD